MNSDIPVSSCVDLDIGSSDDAASCKLKNLRTGWGFGCFVIKGKDFAEDFGGGVIGGVFDGVFGGVFCGVSGSRFGGIL